MKGVEIQWPDGRLSNCQAGTSWLLAASRQPLAAGCWLLAASTGCHRQLVSSPEQQTQAK